MPQRFVSASKEIIYFKQTKFLGNFATCCFLIFWRHRRYKLVIQSSRKLMKCFGLAWRKQGLPETHFWKLHSEKTFVTPGEQRKIVSSLYKKFFGSITWSYEGFRERKCCFCSIVIDCLIDKLIKRWPLATDIASR